MKNGQLSLAVCIGASRLQFCEESFHCFIGIEAIFLVGRPMAFGLLDVLTPCFSVSVCGDTNARVLAQGGINSSAEILSA
ncbi:hypothetical protein CSQ89_14020 [Chitinimonas sp. BJB300]|nr:hypothetical protein CSQ89_14020 [Chitinimonas sp. BJB300]